MLSNQIEILDSTLREGEQTPGVSFTIKQKVTIAKRLDAFGVDFIELGHPAVSPDVYAAVENLNDLDAYMLGYFFGLTVKKKLAIFYL